MLKSIVFFSFLFACEVIQVFTLVFCVARDVNKFDVRLVFNREKIRHIVIEMHVFDSTYIFYPSRILRYSVYVVRANCITISKTQQYSNMDLHPMHPDLQDVNN